MRSNMLFSGEIYTTLAKILHCRRQWRVWQISPLIKLRFIFSLNLFIWIFWCFSQCLSCFCCRLLPGLQLLDVTHYEVPENWQVWQVFRSLWSPWKWSWLPILMIFVSIIGSVLWSSVSDHSNRDTGTAMYCWKWGLVPNKIIILESFDQRDRAVDCPVRCVA